MKSISPSHFFFFLTVRHHPRSTLFPYTTLFRSLLWFALDPADQIASRRLPQRSKSKDDAGEDGDSQRKSKHSTIDANRSDRRVQVPGNGAEQRDRKSTRLNSSHGSISYAVFCLK